MTDSTESFARIDQEHRELRGTLEAVERCGDPHELASMLERLQHQLEHHFEEEEGPEGLAQAAQTSIPQNARLLEHLFEEHGAFLSRTSTLRNRLEGVEAALARIREDVVTLCGDLRRHEERETQLLTDSVFLDIGPGD
jgi:chromosome segregation ATPase